MTITVVTDLTGETGITPRIIRISTTDSFADVTSVNFLKEAKQQGFAFYPTDLVAVSYGSGTSTVDFFRLDISNGDITLIPITNDITVPITSGRIVQFDDTSGTIGNGPVAANKVLTSTIETPDVGANLFCFDVTATAAELADGGEVILVASSGTKQYKVRNLLINDDGVDFTGGGGDRNAQITDGTTVYASTSAAGLATLANSPWATSGSLYLAMDSDTAANTTTAPGANLVFKYFSGTTDYATGSVVISGLIERVA